MTVDTRLRVGLWFLIASGVMVGAWAQFFPRRFTTAFPALAAVGFRWMVRLMNIWFEMWAVSI